MYPIGIPDSEALDLVLCEVADEDVQKLHIITVHLLEGRLPVRTTKMEIYGETVAR